jgi:secreted trypsin-like serine protease
LQQAVVCVFENSVCQVGDPLIICAGVTETIVDTCNGDSGGPLIAVNKTGEYYLAGVTSRGFGCEGKGVYTKVSAFETWILETIGNDSI